jgi:Family of unknown function (DUF5329)
MSNLKPLRLIFTWALIVAVLFPVTVLAQSSPAPGKQKIETLIKEVSDLKDAKFIRNGWTYDVSTATRFLRGKWEANDAAVITAQDFIERVASVSGTSGKPYLIHFNDGREVKSRDFLLAELKKIEH